MDDKRITQRTIKIKLTLSEEQRQNIILSMADASKVFDLFSGLACEHKSTSYLKLHHFGYNDAKVMCPELPTAYTQAVAKCACASVKSFNTNHRSRKWKYKGVKSSSQLPLNKLTFSKRGSLITISSNGKRIRTICELPEWFTIKYDVSDKNIQAGQLTLINNEFWLSIVYKVEKEETQQRNEVIGVDRGLYNIVTLSDGTIISSKPTVAIKRKYQHNRKKLQQKGTRSAKRKLKTLSGREKRFMRDFNHVITKKLSEKSNVSVYVLENLKGIRDSRKGKKLNSWLSNWSFFQLQSFLEYKCDYKGIEVSYVDARYTSQKCNLCGEIKKSNRIKGDYVCSCGYKCHADINAAKNIRDNYVLASTRNRLCQEANSSESVRSATIPTPCG